MHLSECPVSAITPHTEELLNQVALLLDTDSPPPADAPGALLDAIRVCKGEIRATEAAMQEAVNS